MNRVRYFIGPMSKNIVDAIIEYIDETDNQIGFIPSRRQVEHDGGYVNNWTTNQFNKYVNAKAIIKRDHSGPGQGYLEDDGYVSLEEDCKNFNAIHIDPWKLYPNYHDGLKLTASMINFCYKLNNEIEFEIGTEESIRRFKVHELERLVKDLNEILDHKVFKKIRYLVIQSGTSLKGVNNTGSYDKKRLIRMVAVAKKFNLISKEHNGDYIPTELIKEKFKLGLDSINIAPEFGLIETNTYLSYIKDEKLLEIFFRICFESKRWEKWVDQSFNPMKNKIELIKICGHYVLSNKEFIEEIKSKLGDIDIKIKRNIKLKLDELHKF